jgi:hypothetical protein
MTRDEQQAELLLLIDQANNTPSGQLPSGTSSTPTTTTSAAIIGWLNEAQRKVSQECFAVRGSGTQAAVSGTARYDFDSFTVAGTAGTLWAILAASYNGVGLTYMTPANLRLHFPNWQTDASGAPLYWTRHGEDQQVELYPKPNGTSTIAVEGLLVPVDYANGSASPSWLPAYRHRVLVYAAIELMGKKNINDPRIASHLPGWKQQYLESAIPMWQGMDYVTRSLYYPVAPGKVG